MKRYAANIITGCRVLFSVFLLLFPAFSLWFYVLYLTSGITDVIDGPVARKTGSAGAFGSRLDTLADIAFTAAALIKILPAIQAPEWALVWIAVIAAIKVTGIVSGLIRYKKFFAQHTILNKVTGVLLFLLPLTFHFIEMRYSIITVCVAATAAAIQESWYIRRGIEV